VIKRRLIKNQPREPVSPKDASKQVSKGDEAVLVYISQPLLKLNVAFSLECGVLSHSQKYR